MSAERALARLRDADSGALDQLAIVLVDEAASTPISQLARPEWLASQIAAGLEAITRTTRFREAIEKRFGDALRHWSQLDGDLAEYVPDDMLAPLRGALEHPYVPSEGLVFRLLDQQVFRSLMSEVLEGTLKRFRKRVAGVDDQVFGGLGRRVARRGRGLLGGVAENLVGAVAEEVEHQFEKRVSDFLGQATGEALRVVARHAADPDHSGAYAEVRVGILDTLLDTSIAELGEEVDGFGPMAYVDVVLEALRAEVGRDDFVDVTTRRIETLLAEVGDGSFGAWLDEVGLREVWVRSTTELLTQHLHAVVQGDAFEAWWGGLFDE